MMPQQIDAAIRDMCADAMRPTVAALAEKYGFDPEEANRFLATDSLKIVRKRGPAPVVKDDKPKSKKTKKEKDDKPKTKRAKTGYLLFADEVRDEVRTSLKSALADGEKLKPQDVVKAIAAKWKAVDQDVRDNFNAVAKLKAEADSDEEVIQDPVAVAAGLCPGLNDEE